MAYTDAQRDAVLNQTSIDYFGFGIRQFPQGLNGDTLTVWFEDYFQKKELGGAYFYMRYKLASFASRMNLRLFQTSNPRDAFLEVRQLALINGDFNVAGACVPGTDDQRRYKKRVYFQQNAIRLLQEGTYAQSQTSKYVVRHEFLHVFGFEHPFDTKDGDSDTSLTIEDTDMAYLDRPRYRKLIETGEINDGRVGGKLDRRCFDSRLIQANQRDYGPKYNGPF